MSVWKEGHIVGQKRPLKPREVWSIRASLQMLGTAQDVALLNLALDSKLRSRDLAAARVEDVALPNTVRDGSLVVPHETGTTRAP